MSQREAENLDAQRSDSATRVAPTQKTDAQRSASEMGAVEGTDAQRSGTELDAVETEDAQRSTSQPREPEKTDAQRSDSEALGERKVGRRGKAKHAPAKPRVISARVSAETYETVALTADAFGVTISRAAELMLRRHKPIKVSEAQAAAGARAMTPLVELLANEHNMLQLQVQRLGHNVNQLTAATHTGDAPRIELLTRMADDLAAIRRATDASTNTVLQSMTGDGWRH